MAAKRQHIGTIRHQLDRLRHEAARPAEQGGSAGDDVCHAVVGADEDWPVMRDDEVGNAGQAALGVGVVDHQRLPARIGGGRDQHGWVGCERVMSGARRAGEFGKQQMVRRGVGQHDTDMGKAGRHRLGERARHRPQQHDRSRHARSERDFGVRRLRRGAERRGIGNHDRERLGLARFPPAQRRDRRLVARVAQQMKTADALQRDDPSVTQCRGDRTNRVAEARAAGRDRRSVRHGSGGLAGRHSRRHRSRTSRNPPSRSARGRRAGGA